MYERDGFAVTLWTYYEPVTTGREPLPADYAAALARLHNGLRTFDVPSRTSPIEWPGPGARREPIGTPTSPTRSAICSSPATRERRVIHDHGPAEQLLHGEPHPGNLLSTTDGPVFIDLETCCRGPVEFDLAHVPEAVSAHYPALIGAARRLSIPRARNGRGVALGRTTSFRTGSAQLESS